MTTPPNEWEIPVPLAGPAPAPTFPTQALPEWLADMVQETARFTQTDTAMAGPIALAVLATCAAGRVFVEPIPGWREPTNLFIAVVADPGERKSPVHSLLTAPLARAEEHLIDQAKPLIAQQRTLREIADGAAEKARRAAIAGKNDAQALSDEAVAAALAAEAIEVPELPRLLSDDATPEALASLMAANGGRVAIISDEGGIFDMMAGRYTSTPNHDPYLKGHSGTPMRVDRRGRDFEIIQRPALTVGVMIQPAVLRKFAGDSDMAGKGLVARFLLSVPTSRAGWREVETDPIPESVLARYDRNVEDLAKRLAQTSQRESLRLTDAARQLRREHALHIETQLRPGGVFADTRAWASKFAGATLRIAGLLHIAEHPNTFIDHPISDNMIANAIAISDYFAAHNHTAQHLIAADASNNILRKVLDTLIDKEMRQFTRRDLHRRLSRVLPKAKDVAEALDALTSLGWIHPTPEGYALHPHAAEHRKAVDTLTNALTGDVYTAQSHNSPVNNAVDSPLTALTNPPAVNAVNDLSTPALTAPQPS